jgi:multimeric flavodoxin WrbA
MKILALQGSPRPNGNTQTLLDLALDAAREAGADVKVINLREMKRLTGCRECKACQGDPDHPACEIQDDMQPILAQALLADVIVWATPVFCWSPSWLLKMAIDRFYCTFKFTEYDMKSLLSGKKMAAVITAGGGPEDGADLVTEAFRRMTKWSGCRWLGELIAAHADTAEAIRGDSALVERARVFGRMLAS